MTPKYKTLEESPVWQEVSKLSESIRKQYRDINSDDENKEWTITYNLRQSLAGMVVDAAAAAGSIDPRDIFWNYGKVRQSLFTVKATLKLAYKESIIKIDPEDMLKIDTATAQVDKELKEAEKNIKVWHSLMSSEKQ
jgi:hypothetical protein